MRTTMLNSRAFLLLFILVTVASLTSYAQQRGERITVPAGDFFPNQQFTIVNYDNIAEISDRVARATGSVYLNDDWRGGTLYTASGHVLQDAQLRYDIKNDIMEINTPDGVKTLQGRYIRQFELQEPDQLVLYVSGSKEDIASGNHTGFYRILATAQNVKLLSRTELHLQQSNYTPALDVGSKTDKLIKKDKLYLAKDNVLAELERNNYSVFGKYADKVRTYAKDHKLKLHKKEDAVELLKYYSLLKV